jgi:type II secretory ATPase GspE/PulE/Tfp pilus assembly ATPase PilB-like protein
MPNLILSASDVYGPHVSAVKLILMLVFFFAWMPLVGWVHKDAAEVRTNKPFWTAIMAATGAAAIIAWLLVPLFIVGILIYTIAVAAAAIAYVMHRNALVAPFEKVLTPDHIKGLFVNEKKKVTAAGRGFSFVTANGNDVPAPEPKTPESFGYITACEILDDVLWRRASDIVFMPGTDDYTVTYFIDGLGVKQEPRPREEMDFFIHYLKQLGDIDVNEKRKPQKSHFRIDRETERVGWEIITAGSTAGEQLKLSKMGEYSLRKLPETGLTEKQIAQFSEFKELRSALILVSGPPKSGVTSSMYSFLRNHDPFMNNINTLEKQPAAELQNITQHTFDLSDSGSNTYAHKLQSILRMGPEIVGIEGCEDPQSARFACIGAKDGRVVYATLEADSVIQALGKWIKLVADKDLIANVLVAVTNQRLVRRLCEECRQAYQPNQSLLKKFNIPADKIKVLYRPGEIEYDKHGKPIVCEKCQGTGFFGRTAIFETVIVDDNLKTVIRESKSIQEIASNFRRAGMLYLQEQAIRKVAAGITSINEIVRLFSPKSTPQGKTGQ